MPTEPKQPLNFRIGQAYFKRLEEEGAGHGMSPHEYARLLLYRTLDDEGREDVLREVEATKGELAKLREDVSFSLRTVLHNILKDHFDHDEIDGWITQHLGPSRHEAVGG